MRINEMMRMKELGEVKSPTQKQGIHFMERMNDLAYLLIESLRVLYVIDQKPV